MRKRLILVGNKPFTRDMSEVIDHFDFVVRVNRMNNYGLSGTKIDGYHLGMFNDFMNVYHGGEHVQEIRRATQIFAPERVIADRKHIFDYISQEQYDGIECVDWVHAHKDMGIFSPTSTVLMLWHLLNTHWAGSYDIYLTGMDIEGRGEMFMTNPEWSTTSHRLYGDAEEQYIKGLIKDGKIQFLAC